MKQRGDSGELRWNYEPGESQPTLPNREICEWRTRYSSNHLEVPFGILWWLIAPRIYRRPRIRRVDFCSVHRPLLIRSLADISTKNGRWIAIKQLTYVKCKIIWWRPEVVIARWDPALGNSNIKSLGMPLFHTSSWEASSCAARRRSASECLTPLTNITFYTSLPESLQAQYELREFQVRRVVLGQCHIPREFSRVNRHWCHRHLVLEVVLSAGWYLYPQHKRSKRQAFAVQSRYHSCLTPLTICPNPYFEPHELWRQSTKDTIRNLVFLKE